MMARFIPNGFYANRSIIFTQKMHIKYTAFASFRLIIIYTESVRCSSNSKEAQRCKRI